MNKTNKQIRAIISQLLSNDTTELNNRVQELVESTIKDKELMLLEAISNDLRGKLNV